MNKRFEVQQVWREVKKKPVVVKAFQFTKEHFVEVLTRQYCDINGVTFWVKDSAIYIQTLEGKYRIKLNDWIIKGIEGEHYPCKPNIFDKTYEFVE